MVDVTEILIHWHAGRSISEVSTSLKFMPAVNQQQVLGLLFSPTSGVGMNILRLGISSTSSSIEPTSPGGPNATHR